MACRRIHRPALAAGPDKFAVPGLEKPATVLIDRWGVPHIYANTLYDAFFVQGFVAARDRLFQIDLWRKRGLGEMAKDFGPAYVEGDRMARAVLFRGDMYREWLAYGSDAKRVAEAFVAGVNAYIAQTEAHPELLPPSSS
jgi:penicillin amidase